MRRAKATTPGFACGSHETWGRYGDNDSAAEGSRTEGTGDRGAEAVAPGESTRAPTAAAATSSVAERSHGDRAGGAGRPGADGRCLPRGACRATLDVLRLSVPADRCPVSHICGS